MKKRNLIYAALTLALLSGCGSVDNKNEDSNLGGDSVTKTDSQMENDVLTTESSISNETDNTVDSARCSVSVAEEYLKEIFDVACQTQMMLMQSVADDSEMIEKAKRFEDALAANKIQYASPYIVYRFTDEQEEIYYFPIYNGDDREIFFIEGISGLKDGYSDGSAGDANALTEIEYLSNECIVYICGEDLVYESKDNKIQKKVVGADLATADEQQRYQEFCGKTFDEKKAMYDERLKNGTGLVKMNAQGM